MTKSGHVKQNILSHLSGKSVFDRSAAFFKFPENLTKIPKPQSTAQKSKVIGDCSMIYRQGRLNRSIGYCVGSQSPVY